MQSVNVGSGKDARRKGEPVWVLVAIMIGWIGIRAVTWDMAKDPVIPQVEATHAASGHGKTDHVAPDDLAIVSKAIPYLAQEAALTAALLPIGAADKAQSVIARQQGEASLARVYRLLRLTSNERGASGHHVLLHGGAAVQPDGGAERAPVEPGLVAAGAAPLIDPHAALLFDRSARPARRATLSRWSADGWVLWREGGGGAKAGSVLLPSYGANQAGAVLRYRLAPASLYRPAVYGRAYAALNGTAESEVAAGVSARPVPTLPVMVMAEARISRFASGATHLRPAVAVVTELAPVALPGALRGETYVQTGYVGGTGATPFIDGQFRLERVARRDRRTELRLGGGVWGGAQQGAGRLDVGPTATMAFRTARMGARLSLDWRLRVAGNAEPGSGPAITLAAGF